MKKFKDVRVAASLDTFGAKAEYSRKGTIWKIIESNRKLMLKNCPDVYFEITPTISVFSVHSLFEFHKTWVEQGLLNVNNIRVNILTHPRYFSITILPPEYKAEIHKTYIEYAKWLIKQGAHEHIIRSINGIVDYMYSADHSDLIQEFKKEVMTIDTIRNEEFNNVYPELKLL